MDGSRKERNEIRDETGVLCNSTKEEFQKDVDGNPNSYFMIKGHCRKSGKC